MLLQVLHVHGTLEFLAIGVAPVALATGTVLLARRFIKDDEPITVSPPPPRVGRLPELAQRAQNKAVELASKDAVGENAIDELLTACGYDEGPIGRYRTPRVLTLARRGTDVLVHNHNTRRAVFRLINTTRDRLESADVSR
ncbi:MAG: hypothetical protein ACR2MA_05700 [Egibacteraceae bacterium]